jgi:catechol 2,3-dioxygenase-like lactoylglutathione lyase family enzyme
MLGSHDLVAFVATTDRARAREFYVTKLGLPLLHDDGFALVVDAHGTQLRITEVEELRPHNFTVLGWQVPDIVATVRELGARGVELEWFDPVDHDDMGIWEAPSGDRVAWFLDPDRNVLSVTQPAPRP